MHLLVHYPNMFVPHTSQLPKLRRRYSHTPRHPLTSFLDLLTQKTRTSKDETIPHDHTQPHSTYHYDILAETAEEWELNLRLFLPKFNHGVKAREITLSLFLFAKFFFVLLPRLGMGILIEPIRGEYLADSSCMFLSPSYI